MTKIDGSPLNLFMLARFRDIVRGGGGKLSLPYDDMGDAPRKPKGLEP